MDRMRRTHRFHQRGAAALEFAIVLMPMLVLGFGVVEFGRAIYYYDTVVKSVRAAARYIAPYDPSDETAFAVAADKARCLAVFGKTNCVAGDAPLAPGLAKTNVKICTRSSVDECPDLQPSDVYNVSTGTGTGTINLVVLRIEDYQFGFLGLPLVSAGQSLQFNSIEAVMRGV